MKDYSVKNSQLKVKKLKYATSDQNFYLTFSSNNQYLELANNDLRFKTK